MCVNFLNYDRNSKKRSRELKTLKKSVWTPQSSRSPIQNFPNLSAKIIIYLAVNATEITNSSFSILIIDQDQLNLMILNQSKPIKILFFDSYEIDFL